MLRAFALLPLFVAALPAAGQTTNEPTEAATQPPASPADAAAEPAITISGAATLASQYRFRGISLSDEQVAVQGTININHASGLYAGVWASSLDGFGELGGSNVELDLYGGFKKEVAEGVTLDVGLLYYAYPWSEGGDFEFFEPYANVSGTLGPASIKLGVAFAPEQDALGGNSNVYLFGDAGVGIPNTPLTLKAHVGYSKGDTPLLTPASDYLDWSLGADFTYRNLTLGIAYVDTDISDADSLRLIDPRRNVADAAVVATVTASF